MESLGGDRKWIDRFMAGHSAIVYYWVLIIMWLISPTLAVRVAPWPWISGRLLSLTLRFLPAVQLQRAD